MRFRKARLKDFEKLYQLGLDTPELKVSNTNVFIDPEKILFGIPEPKELDTDPDKELYLDMRPVVIQRARVVRLRPCFKSGWKLEFTINVIDDELPSGILQDVLVLAGKTVGVGDYRPKFGRFSVMHFEVLD